MRPAVFLDRDGTIIEHVHHLCHPRDVRLIAGATSAIGELRRAGFAAVVITNQSVVGRGRLTIDGLNEIHATMEEELAKCGAALDGIYYCPLVPMQDDQRIIEHPDRKPGPGMLLRAARELNLDLGRSWMVGDSISDVAAGRNAGCRATILVRTGCGASVPTPAAEIDFVAADLAEAASVILQHASNKTLSTAT